MKYKIKLDVKSYWHAGTGQSSGAYADALVLKDVNGLPYLSGKSLKGVIKEGFYQAQNAQWLSIPSDVNSYLDTVFGSEKGQILGLIRLSNARLEENSYQYLTSIEGKELIPSLFQTIHSTSIDETTGTAIDGSLRSIEVAIPMQLEAYLHFAEFESGMGLSEENYSEIRANFIKNFCISCVFIPAIGANKHKGLGEVSMTIEEQVI